MPTDPASTSDTAILDAAPSFTEPAATPLADELASVRAELDRSRRLLDEAKRDRELRRAAFDAGAIDLDAVTVLAASSLSAATSAETPNPRTAVDALKRTKPHLFRPRAAQSPRSTTMAPNTTDDAPPAIAQAARRAAGGDRNALLMYLRLKRLAAD